MENREIVDNMREVGRIVEQKDRLIARYLATCADGLENYNGRLYNARYADISRISGVGSKMISYVMRIVRGERPTRVAQDVQLRRPRKDSVHFKEHGKKPRIPRRIPKGSIENYGLVEDFLDPENDED